MYVFLLYCIFLNIIQLYLCIFSINMKIIYYFNHYHFTHVGKFKYIERKKKSKKIPPSTVSSDICKRRNSNFVQILMGFSCCDVNIFYITYSRLNGILKALCNLLKRHKWCSDWLIHRLLCCIGHVNKACANIGILGSCHVKYMVHYTVTHISACCI